MIKSWPVKVRGNDVEPGEGPLGAASKELEHRLVLLSPAHANAQSGQADQLLLLKSIRESLLVLDTR